MNLSLCWGVLRMWVPSVLRHIAGTLCSVTSCLCSVSPWLEEGFRLLSPSTVNTSFFYPACPFKLYGWYVCWPCSYVPLQITAKLKHLLPNCFQRTPPGEKTFHSEQASSQVQHKQPYKWRITVNLHTDRILMIRRNEALKELQFCFSSSCVSGYSESKAMFFQSYHWVQRRTWV